MKATKEKKKMKTEITKEDLEDNLKSLEIQTQDTIKTRDDAITKLAMLEGARQITIENLQRLEVIDES